MKRILALFIILALAAVSCACQGGFPTDKLDIELPVVQATPVSVAQSSSTDEYDASNATYITLADGNIQVSGNGVLLGENCVTIADAGVFVLTGKLSDGYILVDADNKDEVQLVLNGVDITCSSYAAIAAMQSDKLTITPVSSSTNSLCDAKEYTVETEQANGCIFSNDNIIFDGGGVLNVTGNYKNAICSDDDIKFLSGTYNLSCVNDALNANEKIRISGGTLNISAGDDAVHSDELLEVSGGEVNIASSYEGLESASITISGGEVNIVAKDDGINGAGGVDASGAAGTDKFASDSSSITVSGGIVNVDAGGDGIDSNGTFAMSGGEVYVSGPTNDGNTALDYNGTATISGGILAAAGSAGMAQGVSESSQCSVMITYSSEQQPGTQASLKNASGETVVSYTPVKKYRSIILSAPGLVKDGVYTLYAGETKLMEYTQTDDVMSLSDSGETVNAGMGGMGGAPAAGGSMHGGTRPGSMTDAPAAPTGSATDAPFGGGAPSGGAPSGGAPSGGTPPDGTPPEPPTGN